MDWDHTANARSVPAGTRGMRRPVHSLARAAGLVVTLAVAVAGCGGSDESEPATGAGPSQNTGPATVQFVGPETPETFAPLINAFKKRNPTIDIKYTSVPFDQLNSVLQQRLSAKDDSIDVFTADQSRIPSLAARGFLEDLSDLKPKADQAALRTTVEASTYQGKLYSLPIWTSSQFLYYNKDLLRKAGVEAPDLDPQQRWTWEQVEAAAKRAQRSGGARHGLLFDQVDRYYQLQVLPESAGGGSGVTGEQLLTPDLTNPGWIRAMEFYRRLHEEKVSPRGVAVDQMNPLFARGRAAFFVGGPWAIPAFAEEEDLNWGIAPHPYFEGGKPATPTDSWSWGLNPASKNKDAARKFMEFASLSKEGAEASIAQVFIIPSEKQAFEDYKVRLEQEGGSATRGAAELMQYELDQTAVHRPRSIGYTQMEDQMLKVFADIRNGAQPRQRLDKANQQLDSTWSRLRK